MKEEHYNAAKAFIVYRNRHTEDRQTAQKLRFLIDYCNADNAATGSKFDANAKCREQKPRHPHTAKSPKAILSV